MRPVENDQVTIGQNKLIQRKLQPFYRNALISNFELTVELELQASRGLVIHYRLAGALDQLLIPSWSPASMVDNLWQHTCFELFLAEADHSNYREYNFAPSGQWTQYAFSSYRQRVDSLIICAAPEFELDQQGGLLSLKVRIPAENLPLHGRPDTWEFGLSAVLEDWEGGLSYWALRHPGHKPDFHDRAGFIRLFAHP